MLQKATDIDALIWEGTASCLVSNRYACDLDWKEELDEFIGAMNNLNYGIKFDKEGLEEYDYIAEWCEELDKRLQADNLCIGDFDLNGDCFVMFVCERNILEQLSEMAQGIDHRIAYASQM